MDDATESLGLDLRNDFDDKVARVRDVDLGRQLGMVRPSNIRQVIESNLEFINALGVCTRRVQNHGGGRGRPATEYWLTEKQAFWLATQSGTDEGKRTAVLLVEVFDAFRRMAIDQLPPFLRAEFAPWRKTWKHDLMVELCRLRGEIFTGRHPRWGAHINSVIYECLLGRELYALLKAQNPKPSKGHNHHQLIDEAYRNEFDARLSDVKVIVRSSFSMADAESRLRFSFQGEPMQLPLLPPQRALPGLTKALPAPRQRKLGQPA